MINKISKILQTYKKNGAKTWEIGTDFYGSWSQMAKNLKQFPLTMNLPTKIVLKKIIDNNLNERFKMLLGDKNITPITTKKDCASSSAIRQYLQEGSALDFLSYSEGDSITDEASFSINPKIWDLQKDESTLTETILLALMKSTSSKIYFERNFGYSLFLAIVDEYDESIFNNFSNYILEPKTLKSFTPAPLSSYESKQYIKHVKGEHTELYGCGKRTYITAISKLKKYGLGKVIDATYNYIINPNSEEFIDQINTNNQKLYDQLSYLYKKLQSKRLNLKLKIKEQRVGDSQKYSDLNCSPPNDTRIELLRACHIYDVWRIKKDIKTFVQTNKTIDGVDKFLFEVDDPNNGILLNSTCHDMFDDGIVWFDTDGYLCFRNEHKEDVIKHFGEKLNKISLSCLNDEMKKYLVKRNIQ